MAAAIAAQNAEEAILENMLARGDVRVLEEKMEDTRGQGEWVF